MSDERKKMKKAIIQKIKGNEIRLMKRKHDCRIWELSHRDNKQRGKRIVKQQKC